MPITDIKKREYLTSQGLNPDDFEDVNNSNNQESNQPVLNPTPQTSALGAGGRSFLRSATPTAVGLGVGAATSELTPLVSIPLGVGAGMLASYLQRKGADAVIPNSPFGSKSEQQDTQEHPYASFAGDIVPQALALRPSIPVIKGAANAAASGLGLRLTKSTALENAALGQVGLGAALPVALGYGQEAYNQGTITPKLDVGNIAAQAITGGLLHQPYGAGKYLGLHPLDMKEINGQNIMKDAQRQGGESQGDIYNKQQAIKANEDAGLLREQQVQAADNPITIREQELAKIKAQQEADKQAAKQQKTDAYQAQEEAEAANAQIAKDQEFNDTLNNTIAERQALEKQKEDLSKQRQLEFEKAKVEELKSEIEAGSKLPVSQGQPKPITTTVEGDKVYPDYTGNIEHDIKVNESKPLTEAERIQEEYDSGKRKQEGEVEQPAIEQKPTKAYEDTLTKLGESRNVKTVFEPLTDEKGKPINAQVDNINGAKEVIAKIHPGRADVTTQPHEYIHPLLQYLAQYGTGADKLLVKRAYKTIGEHPDFKAWQDNLNPESSYKSLPHEAQVDEYLTKIGGEDAVRRLLQTDKKGYFRNLLQDIYSNVKHKFNKATPEDYAKLISSKLLFERPHSQGIGPAIEKSKGLPINIGGVKNQEDRTGVPGINQEGLQHPIMDTRDYKGSDNYYRWLKDEKGLSHEDATKQAKAVFGETDFSRMVPKETKKQEGPITPANQTSTPGFKKWFGESKVVDKEGKPLVVYHGTQKGGFNIFHPEQHFGTLEQVHNLLYDKATERNKYYDPKKGSSVFGESDSVYPTYLNIKNPKLVDDVGNSFNWSEEVAKAKKEGYDGLKYSNTEEGFGYSYLPFEPTQIKSAIGNEGTFDSKNPDIRKQEGSLNNEPPKLEPPKDFSVPGFRSLLDKVPNEDLKKAFGNFYDKYNSLKGSLVNEPSEKIRKLTNLDSTIKSILNNPKDYATQNPEEFQNVLANFYGEKKTSELTPTELKIKEAVQESLHNNREEHISRSDNLRKVEDFNPEYFPQPLNKKSGEELTQRPNSDKAKQYEQDFLQHSEKNTPEKLKEFMEALKKGSNDKASHFGPIDSPAGVGLPKSMRETNLLDILNNHNDRVSRRFAFSDEIQSKPEIMKLLKEYAGNDVVKEIHNNIKGQAGDNSSFNNPTIKAAMGLANAGALGTLTGAKIVAQAPFLSAPHFGNPFQLAKATVSSIKNFTSNMAEGFKSGRITRNMSSLELGGDSDLTNVLRRTRDIISDVTGRNYLHQVARAINYGQGKWAAMNYHEELMKGNLSISGKKFFKDFADGVDINKKSLSPEDLMKISGRFVDSVQGTFDYRGQPKWTMEDPFFSLARWSIERGNNYVKHSINPLLNGNPRPFLMSTLGQLIGGSAVVAISDAITKRKSKTPTYDEIANSENKGMASTYKAIGLAAAAGHAGILADLAKSVMDVTYAKSRPQVYGNMLVDAADSVATNTGNFIKAANENGISPHLVFDYVSKLLEDNIQTSRLILNLVGPETTRDIEKNNKLRDLRTFNLLNNNKVPDLSSDFNTPFDAPGVKDFKKTTDVNEAAKLLPELVNAAIEKSKGNPEKLKSELGKLKENSYPTMPNPDNMPINFVRYIDYLNRTQGKEEASKRLLDYIKTNTINKSKSSTVPSI